VAALLELKNLKTYFKRNKTVIPAVDGVDLVINKGETVALVGESGSGKSITSLSIMRLIPSPPGEIVDGQINFEGVDLTKLSEDEMCKIRGNDISMIFQEPMTSLNPVLTIGEQITEVLTYHQNMNKSMAMKKAIEMLEMVGFSRANEIVNDYPHRLSGGMRQRVLGYPHRRRGGHGLPTGGGRIGQSSGGQLNDRSDQQGRDDSRHAVAYFGGAAGCRAEDGGTRPWRRK